MGRTVVRQLDPPRTRKTRDRVLFLALGLVLLFALFGLASAAKLLADQVSSNTAAGSKHHGSKTGTNTGSSAAGVAQAHAQATAIVKAAQDAGNAILKGDTAKAHRQAAAIIAAAHKKARTIAATVPTPVPAAPTVAPASGTTSGTAAGGTTTGTTSGTTTSATGSFPVATPIPYTTAVSSASVPNLSGVPASWQVVGYNASFGSGPGSAGSISVINRSSRAYSGVAEVVYSNGDTARASFSGLAPGQAITLPLDGPAYRGGGYKIVLTGLHYG